MNVSEERAWKLLIELGAKEIQIFDKHALDLSTIRATTKNKLCLLVQATLDVVGHSGANRRHVDRRGCPVYVVTDYYTIKSRAADRHQPEIQALLKKRQEREAEDAPTSWAIHTMGGPIRRIFSTLEMAKRWATTEWTFPQTIDDLVGTQDRTAVEIARARGHTVVSLQRSLADESTAHFKSHASGTLVFEEGCEDDYDFTWGIRYEGEHERLFATICERQHCVRCTRVVATRSTVDGVWNPASVDHAHWPKDLEDDR